MINPRISADWSTTKPIAAFSCTPGVQVEHTKAEVVHLTPGLLGLGVLFNCYLVLFQRRRVALRFYSISKRHDATRRSAQRHIVNQA